MKTLTNKIKKQADSVIEVKSETDIPLTGLPLAIAKAELKFNKFYGYTRVDLNQRILLIQV